MTSNTTTACTGEAEDLLFDSWFDPIEDGLRARVRGFIETMIEEELTSALSRPRYARHPNGAGGAGVMGHRHGDRTRRLTGTFGPTEIDVPRARLLGDKLFAFTRLPLSQWKSARTNAIERLHEEFKRRIKTQTILPSADTAAMLFWALLASGQMRMRKIDGWQSLATLVTNQPVALAA